MLGRSRLNVYILASDLSPRQRGRIQAQVETALRSLPPWVFELLDRRIDSLAVQNLPLVIEPLPRTASDRAAISLGRIESRPAVKLTPALRTDGVDWGQDLRRLLAKGIAFICAPDDENSAFWRRWQQVAASDRLREQASAAGDDWRGETDLGLLIEMFGAFVLSPQHSRWATMPAVRVFMEDWRQSPNSG